MWFLRRSFLVKNSEAVGRKYLATFIFFFDYLGVLAVLLLCLIGEGPALLCSSMRSELMVIIRSKISSRLSSSVASPPGPSPSRSSGGEVGGGRLHCSSYRVELAGDKMSERSPSCCDSDFGRLRCDSLVCGFLGSQSSLRLTIMRLFEIAWKAAQIT